jgi:hypothetical protein
MLLHGPQGSLLLPLPREKDEETDDMGFNPRVRETNAVYNPINGNFVSRGSISG